MYKWRKDIASWKVGDTLYMSIPFTWLLPKAEEAARSHRGKVIAGGPAVRLVPVSWAQTPEAVPFDILALHNPCATFTSRGCPNRCRFCAVPVIEPDFCEYREWKAAPLICDNNLLATRRKHFSAVIESAIQFPFVDLQGLQPRMFTEWHARQITRLHKCRLHFGFDEAAEEADAHRRLELIRAWGARPFSMRFQPLDSLVKNSFVAEGWTETELRRTMNYHNRLRWYEHIPCEDFQHLKINETMLMQEDLDFA
jgi:hypothetical protein